MQARGPLVFVSLTESPKMSDAAPQMSSRHSGDREAARSLADTLTAPSSNSANAIGFDADMCLVKYNVKAFYCLFVKCILEELHEKHGYPEEILNFDYSNEESEDLNLMMNSMVFDFKTGILLKLGEDKRILVALRGRRVMEPDEVQKLYGGPVPKFDAINWP